MATAFPAEDSHFTALSELFKDKLWFQLTEKLGDLLSVSHFQQPPHLLDLYTKFVKSFEKDLNKLSLAQFMIAASRQHEDYKSAMKFLDSAEIVKKDPQAEVMCNMEKVTRMIEAGELGACSTLLEGAKSSMDKFVGIMDPVVHSSYYKSHFLFSKAKNDPTKMFSNALLYLSYTPIEKIPETAREAFAYDVSMAALVGKDIFNFGELLERPVTKVLAESKTYAWALDLLQAFNTGDIKAYDDIFAQKASSQPFLAENKKFLSIKIRILRLMVTVFNRPSHQRAIAFEEIAKTCDTKINEVEFVVMKAFSLGVLRGVIDQVSQTITITWVQPRVLGKDQIKGMSKRLKEWSEEVLKATADVEEHSGEILHE
uniref:PCI domain-containing protein n=1 Tax=Amorphochlora amoebiformis TaxID=1561963 RepID=A0A7S0H7C6_9EUKA